MTSGRFFFFFFPLLQETTPVTNLLIGEEDRGGDFEKRYSSLTSAIGTKKNKPLDRTCWLFQLVRKSDFTKPQKEQSERLSVSCSFSQQRMCWQDKENHYRTPVLSVLLSQCLWKWWNKMPRVKKQKQKKKHLPASSALIAHPYNCLQHPLFSISFLSST